MTSVRSLGLLFVLSNAAFSGDLLAVPAVAGEQPGGAMDGESILEENPALVARLLRRASIDDDEEALITLYCLGPSVTPTLLEKLESEDAGERAVAMAALTYVSAYDEGVPRPAIVRALLALDTGGDDELDAGVYEVLTFVVRSSHPEFRAAIRRAIESELTEEIAGHPTHRTVVSRATNGANPAGGLSYLYEQSVEDGERVVRSSWPVPFVIRESVDESIESELVPARLLRGPADFFQQSAATSVLQNQ